MATKKTSGRKATKKGASKEIREEMHAVKQGKVKDQKQAIAIGLSRARRAGKDVPPPKKGTSSPAVRKKALQDIAAGKKTASKKTASKKTVAKKSSRKSASKRRS